MGITLTRSGKARAVQNNSRWSVANRIEKEFDSAYQAINKDHAQMDIFIRHLKKTTADLQAEVEAAPDDRDAAARLDDSKKLLSAMQSFSEFELEILTAMYKGISDGVSAEKDKLIESYKTKSEGDWGRSIYLDVRDTSHEIDSNPLAIKKALSTIAATRLIKKAADRNPYINKSWGNITSSNIDSMTSLLYAMGEIAHSAKTYSSKSSRQSGGSLLEHAEFYAGQRIRFADEKETETSVQKQVQRLMNNKNAILDLVKKYGQIYGTVKLCADALNVAHEKGSYFEAFEFLEGVNSVKYQGSMFHSLKDRAKARSKATESEQSQTQASSGDASAGTASSGTATGDAASSGTKSSGTASTSDALSGLIGMPVNRAWINDGLSFVKDLRKQARKAQNGNGLVFTEAQYDALKDELNGLKNASKTGVDAVQTWSKINRLWLDSVLVNHALPLANVTALIKMHDNLDAIHNVQTRTERLVLLGRHESALFALQNKQRMTLRGGDWVALDAAVHNFSSVRNSVSEEGLLAYLAAPDNLWERLSESIKGMKGTPGMTRPARPIPSPVDELPS